MVWKESDCVSERLEFVRLADKEAVNFSALCQRFGVSRKTGYKWLRRWRDQGDDGLHDLTRRPCQSPGKTSQAVEEEVLQVRADHPAWGGRKIRRRLMDLGASSVPSASTITAILHRHGLISEEVSSAHRAFTRFERNEPNELWQMDFKGEFKLSNGRWCYPLTLLDDHSRYSLGLEACENQRRVTVQEKLRTIFRKYGIPRAIYVDNGSPWGTPHRGFFHTRASVWLMRHCIEVIHGRPCHPQGRGKLERFHRTFNLEVLQERIFNDGRQAQRAFDPWRTSYNHDRPHEAIEMEVPSSRYQVSRRCFKEKNSPYDYSSRFTIRKAKKTGEISFHGTVYRVSEAFADQHMGIAPTRSDGIWDVYYCRFVVGQIDERERTIRRHQPVG